MKTLYLIFALSIAISSGIAQHHAGESCSSCHEDYVIAGTLFSSRDISDFLIGESIVLISPDGSERVLDVSNDDGNFFETWIEPGSYLIELGAVSSKAWHKLPDMGQCNTCHKEGGNSSSTRTKRIPSHHTKLPADNDCKACHHFPATMELSQISTTGILSSAYLGPVLPESFVQIQQDIFVFNPEDHQIVSLRKDIFAPGYYSMFDVIIAVCKQNNIDVQYYYDASRKTHFITSLKGINGDFWYGFSYDVRNYQGELAYNRQYRWDEALWRPGVKIQLRKPNNLIEFQ